MDYNDFKKKFVQLTGFDLDSYKDKQMERRISHFMKRVKVDHYYDYYKLLESCPRERTGFINFLTIHTTSFFRDPAVFRNLKNKVLPEILERKKNRVKIWSAGCSIGAEPYSLSILMIELVGSNSKASRYSIVATDIEPQVLHQAQLGRFFLNQLEHISEKSLQKYFFPVGDALEVKPEVKNRVIFKEHDLLKDPFEKGCDLILCRNVFIYFKPETQEKLLVNFIEALNPLGYMVVGCSESISSFQRFGLQKVDMAIYQKHKTFGPICRKEVPDVERNKGD